jgi:N-acetylglucosaminylphosphatidylinositol deacetylase
LVYGQKMMSRSLKIRKLWIPQMNPRQKVELDYSNFPDSMIKDWDAKRISNLLTATFAPKMANLSANESPSSTIDILITFDATGVSNHPNHRSLYHGSVAFIKSLMHGRSGWECPVTMYTLTSISIFRKYLSVFDAPASFIAAVLAKKDIGATPTPLLFVSSIGEWRRAQGAMTTAHKSQMRWFRWGWIGLSRYMVVNDLKKERIR